MRPVLITRLTGLASSLALFSIGTPIHAMADDPTALHLPFTDAAFSFPSELSGALRVSANLNGYAIPFAVSGRYANSDSVVTFYVYRGSYNSVALWFERIEAVTPIL